MVDRRRILRRYLFGRFWHALLSSFPADTVLFLSGHSVDDGAIMIGGLADDSAPLGVRFGWGEAVNTPGEYASLLRIFCFWNVVLYFSRWDWQAVNHTIIDRLSKNLMLGLVGCHWLACGWCFVARLAAQSGVPLRQSLHPPHWQPPRVSPDLT